MFAFVQSFELMDSDSGYQCNVDQVRLCPLETAEVQLKCGQSLHSIKVSNYL